MAEAKQIRTHHRVLSDYLNCFLFCVFPSLTGGLAAFCVVLRWFPVAEMLRSLALDSLLLALLLLLPVKFGRVLLVLVFPFVLLIAIFAAGHVALYQSPLSSFAVQAVLETSSSEAAEFLTDFATVPLFVLITVITALAVFFCVTPCAPCRVCVADRWFSFSPWPS